MISTYLPVVISCVLIGAVSLARAAEPTAEKYQPGTIAHALQPFVDGNQISGGVMLVADKNKVLVTECVGYSDRDNKVPMKPNDVFFIASMTKAMTSTCIMMLVDEGKLSLEDPVEKYIPEYHGQMVVVESDENHKLLRKPKAPVTIKQLLTHTSGVLGGNPYLKSLDDKSLKERIVANALTPLMFEPGTQFSYGNGGYETAGRIIEIVTGESYWQFMLDRLIKPLGMKDTDFVLKKSQLPRFVKLYTPDEKFTKMDYTPMAAVMPLTSRNRCANPAGGLYSTAQDIARYCQMLLNGGQLDGRRYLSEKSVGIMTTTQTGTIMNGGESEVGYGLGWNTSQYFSAEHPLSKTLYSHSGAFRTDMCVDPEHGLVMVFMTQRGNLTDSSAFTRPFWAIAQKYFGSK